MYNEGPTVNVLLSRVQTVARQPYTVQTLDGIRLTSDRSKMMATAASGHSVSVSIAKYFAADTGGQTGRTYTYRSRCATSSQCSSAEYSNVTTVVGLLADESDQPRAVFAAVAMTLNTSCSFYLATDTFWCSSQDSVAMFNERHHECKEAQSTKPMYFASLHRGANPTADVSQNVKK